MFKVRIDRRDPEEVVNPEVDADGVLIGEEFNPDDIPAKGGWNASDPGVGRAVLLPDGREVLNPVPMAPPVGFKEEDSMMEVMEKMIKRHLHGLRDEDELDSVEDALDFDVPDDLDIVSPYDVEMMEEFPAMPPPKSEEEEVEEEKGVAPEPPKKKKAAKPVPPPPDDEDA